MSAGAVVLIVLVVVLAVLAARARRSLPPPAQGRPPLSVDPRDRLAQLSEEMLEALEEIAARMPAVGARGPRAALPRADCALCHSPLHAGAYLICDRCFERVAEVDPGPEDAAGKLLQHPGAHRG